MFENDSGAAGNSQAAVRCVIAYNKNPSFFNNAVFSTPIFARDWDW